MHVALLIATSLLGLAPTSTKFELTDPKSAVPLAAATETVEATATGERRTTTYNAEGGGARQIETYDTGPDGAPLRYAYEDLETGERIEVESTGDRWAMSYRASTTSGERRAQVDKTPRVMPGKAIPSLILAQWATLGEGRRVTFGLLVPQQMTSYDFDVRRDLSAAQPTFVVEASHWLIRQFAPRLVFVFDAAPPHRIARYDGPAAVPLHGEKYRPVTITFAADDGHAP